MGAFRDLTGAVFGRLTVEKFNGRRNKRSYWACVCECGAETEVRGDCLTTGGTTSCGCAQKDAVSASNTKHGMCDSDEYKIWTQMRYRCHKPSTPCYDNYGGRGIFVCDAWRDSFDTFYEDMGQRPSKSHSIERLDNDKGYSPENCVWATPKAQGNNKRTCRMLTHDGVTMTATQWAEKVGIGRTTLYGRLKSGMGVSEAITRPVGRWL